MKDPAIRFHKHYIPVPESGCWLWTAYTCEEGYGIFSIKSKLIKAHRFSYELHKGPIPEGLTIDHLCRVPCCVNPDHLEAVTNKTNILRGYNPAAMNMRKTHCVRGHPLTPDNIYPNNQWGRICVICARTWGRIQMKVKKPRLPVQ